MRWQPGTGPGLRRPALATRLKRWLAARLARDPRLRRLVMNEIFTHHAAPGVLLRVPFPDHALFVDPRDDRITATLLQGKPWQRDHLVRAIATLARTDRLAPGGTFLDVGANIGALTVYALLSGTFKHAVALEPDPDNRVILTRNLAENQLSDRTTVIEAAASGTGHEATLHRDRKNLGAHSLEPGFSMSAGDTITITADRLDSLLANARNAKTAPITLAKIDVEGHEFAVLEGATDLLARRTPLMIEVAFTTPADRTRLLSLLESTYSTCLDLATPDAEPTPLAAFGPSALQHDLLIL
jgi:FkbM family methyltransferase